MFFRAAIKNSKCTILFSKGFIYDSASKKTGPWLEGCDLFDVEKELRILVDVLNK